MDESLLIGSFLESRHDKLSLANDLSPAEIEVSAQKDTVGVGLRDVAAAPALEASVRTESDDHTALHGFPRASVVCLARLWRRAALRVVAVANMRDHARGGI